MSGVSVVKSCEQLASFVRSEPLCLAFADVASRCGVQAVLVGGVIRDWLLGRPALDWDLVVSGEPESFARAWSKHRRAQWVVLDAEFGVVRLRLETGLVVDVSRMQGESLTHDLARRDITLNAMACGLNDGVVYDPMGGYGDLQAGVVRAIARDNLVSDPVRLLRIYRFAAVLGFTIAPQTREWVSGLASRLDLVAGERIWAEWSKLVVGPKARDVLGNMRVDGLLSVLLGHPTAACDSGVTLFGALMDAMGRHSEVDGWLGGTLGGVTDRRQALGVAALLVPLAWGEDSYERLLARLRVSRREARFLLKVQAAFRGDWEQALGDPVEAYRLVRRLDEAGVGVGLLAEADGSHAGDALMRACRHWADSPLPRVVTGDVLLRELDLKPGPLIARLLELVEAEQVRGVVQDEASALEHLRRVRGQWAEG